MSVPDAPVDVRDSAGVTVVTLGADLPAYATPRLGLARLFAVGEEGSGLELSRVHGARFLPSGRLAVADGGTQEILLLDGEGALVERVGGPGEGPGEFGALSDLLVSGGEMIVYDDAQGRLTRFDGDGELLGTRSIAAPSRVADFELLAATPEGPALGVYADQRRFRADGRLQDTTPLLLFRSDTLPADTLAMVPSTIWEFASIAEGMMRIRLAFTPTSLYAGRSGRVALASSHEPVVRTYRVDGTPLEVLRWEASARVVTAPDHEAWLERRREELPEGAPASMVEVWMAAPAHDTHPVLDDLAVDLRGRLWLAPSPAVEGDRRIWVVLGPGGTVVGGVELPREARVLDATTDRLAVLVRNELDVETVVIYETEFAHVE